MCRSCLSWYGATEGDGGPILRLLGRMELSHAGVRRTLPRSRKVRALLAYLTLSACPVGRGRICELFWDVPNDPRGELRWCVSKIRSLLNEQGRERVIASGDTISLDLTGCFIDALEVTRAIQAGTATIDGDRLRALAALFAGEFLDGLEFGRGLLIEGWIAAQRRRFRTCRIALLDALVSRTPPRAEGVDRHIETWLEIAPFDQRAHRSLFRMLVNQGRILEGEKHLAATVRLFEAEGLDTSALIDAWKTARRALPKERASGPGASSSLNPSPTSVLPVPTRRASIAILPFLDRNAFGRRGGMGDGLAHDIITRLAKLRSLTVIGQGTVFALDERGIGMEVAARTLKVDYVVNGSVWRKGVRITVSVELVETRAAKVIWAEIYDDRLPAAFNTLENIGNRIVSCIAHEIETAESALAILKPPNSLDAWEAHHRGLWHMYRFSRADNDLARQFFETAVRLDPTFSRAQAGLSFTHFQDAFQGWRERESAIDDAFRSAECGLKADDRDPAAHWAMGRALWLRDHQEQSISELQRAVDLSPNFALGHYTLGFVHSQSGDPLTAIQAADKSRELSPFDPLLIGMLGSRAMALMRMRQFEEAANWAVKAAARPNAHAHVQAIAVHCLALAGRRREARAMMLEIRRLRPRYGVEDFLAAHRFSPEIEEMLRRSAEEIDFR